MKVEVCAGSCFMCNRRYIPAVPGSSSDRQPVEPALPWPPLPPASPSQAAQPLPSPASSPAPAPTPCGSAPPALKIHTNKQTHTQTSKYRDFRSSFSCDTLKASYKCCRLLMILMLMLQQSLMNHQRPHLY